MSRRSFRLFPRHEGYRVWMIEPHHTVKRHAVTTHLEDRLSDYGVDVDRHPSAVGVISPGGEYLPRDVPGARIAGVAAGHGRTGRRARAQRARAPQGDRVAARGRVFAGGHSQAWCCRKEWRWWPADCCWARDARSSRSLPALRDRAQSLPLVSLGGLLVAVSSPGRRIAGGDSIDVRNIGGRSDKAE